MLDLTPGTNMVQETKVITQDLLTTPTCLKVKPFAV